MEKRILQLMTENGLSVGEAVERMQRDAPDEWSSWADANMKTTDGWQSWAEGLSAQADSARKERSNIDFMRVVKLYESEGMNRTAALKKAVRYFPVEHEQWLAAQQPGAAPAPSVKTRREPSSFEACVAENMKMGLKRSQALSRAARDFPELHERYVREFNEDRRRAAERR